VDQNVLLLGVDGGGTRCRARLCAFSGKVLGEAETGPANLRLGLTQSFAAVVQAADYCIDRAEMSRQNRSRIVACLALAGASEPAYLAAAERYRLPFHKAVIIADAHAACVGAHGDSDGGVIVAGTGAVGWAVVKGQIHRVGGWGLALSDEGSGAWLGAEALRRVLWASDGRTQWTPLLRLLFADFGNDPHTIVAWTASASPRDFGSLAPRVVEHAGKGDVTATELMELAANYIDALAEPLLAAGASRLALVGGFASSLQPWLSETTKSHLVEPAGDALSGALRLARASAESLVRVA
jgi:glucosamine kinase